MIEEIYILVCLGRRGKKISLLAPIYGLAVARLAAVRMLTNRGATSIIAANSDFNPSMLDESAYRNELESLFNDRVLLVKISRFWLKVAKCLAR